MAVGVLSACHQNVRNSLIKWFVICIIFVNQHQSEMTIITFSEVSFQLLNSSVICLLKISVFCQVVGSFLYVFVFSVCLSKLILVILIGAKLVLWWRGIVYDFSLYLQQRHFIIVTACLYSLVLAEYPLALRASVYSARASWAWGHARHLILMRSARASRAHSQPFNINALRVNLVMYHVVDASEMSCDFLWKVKALYICCHHSVDTACNRASYLAVTYLKL